ncbi:MAG: ATP-binding protein [Sphingomonadales bacterium]
MATSVPKKTIKVTALGARQRALVAEKVAEPIIMVTSALKIIFANSAAIKFFGHTLVGGNLSKILPDDEVVESISATLEDGTVRAMASSISKPVPRSFEVTIAAITPEEQDKRQHGEGLKNLAVIAFHDTTALKAAKKLRTDFITIAGAELKTPLASLLGFIETLEGPAEGDADALKTYLPIMHSEAERMTKVINDLMSLAKIEAQDPVAAEAEVSLFELCEDVKSAMEPPAQSRDITLKFHVAPNLPPVCGEAEQINQALCNVISNAIKFGNKGSVVRLIARVVRSTGSSKKPGMAISISDEGQGISPKNQARLTERFFQVDSARSKSGTGLGLTIVRQIVIRHRGTLNIESTFGKGTTVTLTLPQA